jgi:hypothetical protein
VTPAYPSILQLQRRLASRFPWTFPVAMLSPWNPPTPDRTRYESWFLMTLDDDLRAQPPALVFVHAHGGCQACPYGFSLLNYFQRHGLFDGALARYVQVGDTGRFAVFAPR